MSKPSYYITIPSRVRYDTNLTCFEKLLYGEISLLCAKYGYCWASNAYFANMYAISKETVKKSITHLVELNYIRREVKYRTKRTLCILNMADVKLNESQFNTEESITKQSKFNKVIIKRSVKNYTPTTLKSIYRSVKNYTPDTNFNTQKKPRSVKNYTHNNKINKDYNNINIYSTLLSKDNKVELQNPEGSVHQTQQSVTQKPTTLLKDLQKDVIQKKTDSSSIAFLLKEKNKKKGNEAKHTQRTGADITPQTRLQTTKRQAITNNTIKYFLSNYDKIIPLNVCSVFCDWIKYQMELGGKVTKTFIDSNAKLVIDRLDITEEEEVIELIKKALLTQHRTLMYIFEEHKRNMKWERHKQPDGSVILIPVNVIGKDGRLLGPRHISKEHLEEQKKLKDITEKMRYSVLEEKHFVEQTF